MTYKLLENRVPCSVCPHIPLHLLTKGATLRDELPSVENQMVLRQEVELLRGRQKSI